MEEVVWVLIGILSLLLVLGILSNFMLQKQEDDKIQAAKDSIEELYDMCYRVCNLPEKTLLKTLVIIPAGSKLSTKSETVCMELGEEKYCRRCPCSVRNETVLDLTNEETGLFFTTSHDYNCFFRRNETFVDIDCKG